MLWTAAIVAGGSTRRLGGRDKSTLLVGGRSILDRQLSEIRPFTDHLLVVGAHPDRVAPVGVPAVEDLVTGAGALGGIYTALSAADTERVVVVACDMPFLTGRFLAHLAAATDGVEAAIPRPADGYQPMCACYTQSCLEPVRRRLARHALRVQDLVADVRLRELGPDELAPFDPDGILFFNINTIDDYRRAERIDAERDRRARAQADRITQPSRAQQDR